MPSPKSISTETERVIRVGKVEALVDFCFGRTSGPQRAYLECRDEERVDEQWYGVFSASYRENYAKLAGERAPADQPAELA